MGIKFSFPLQQIPIAYHPASYFTCIGKYKDQLLQQNLALIGDLIWKIFISIH